MNTKIKEIREIKGLTQQQLADKCGISRVQIGLIERGQSDVRLCTLIKILDALEVTLTIKENDNTEGQT